MNKYKILVLSDEPIVSDMIRIILEKEGYDVVIVSKGEDALDAADKNSFDLFLTDIMPPNRHGVAVSWDMRMQGHEFPIVILSAFLDQWDKEVFKDCKIDACLSKPCKPKQLTSKIAELLN